MENHATGHRERLREKFIEAGTTALADYEMLELLLMQSIPRRDVKPLAKKLIAQFGSFPKVLDADYNDLLSFDGVGKSTAFSIKLSAGINQTYGKNHAKEKINLGSFFELVDYLYTKMASLTHEEFHAIFLDSKNNLIKDEALFKGSVNSAAVYPREVVKFALKYGATSIVVAHNHPSGDPTPSTQDDILTIDLKTALHTMNIKMIDHIIIGDGEHYSYAQSGKL